MKYILTAYLSMNFIIGFTQQNFCADSSYRVKYIFENSGAALLCLPDTAGFNILQGPINNSILNSGLGIAKTNWGDSILWARKIIINGSTFNSYRSPDGSIFLIGTYGNTPNQKPLIIKTTSNGKVLWAKQYIFPNTGNTVGIGKVLLTNNAIYFSGLGLTKLDMNGNIVWSKTYSSNAPRFASIADVQILNNELYALGTSGNTTYFGAGSEPFLIVGKFNDNDGSLLSCSAYKAVSDGIIKGISMINSNLNNDHSFSLAGFIHADFNNTGYYIPSLMCYVNFDSSLNSLESNYFRSGVALDIFGGIQDINALGEKAAIGRDIINISSTSFFLNFNRNNTIKRSRKIIIPQFNPVSNGYGIKLDNKQNIHFLYNYMQGGILQTEYARISDFAPNSTLGCFGKDTSILVRYPFTLKKETFAFDNMADNSLYASDVPYTEDTAFVTKQLVCKIVSYCDSIHIKGPASTCVNTPVRYSIYRNNSCQKFADWNIDTSFASIVNMEGDSAITLSFKKPFTGYLHAALADCVIKDSFLIKALVPKMPPLINRTDSLLCPGKTITLAANNSFTNYLWQGGTPNSKQLTVNAAGTYRITASDSCNNPVIDSITVTVSDTSLTLPAAQTICLSDTARIILPAGMTNITWLPATNSLLRNTTIIAWPAQTTLYSVTAERQTNCPISRVSLVTVKNCPQTFYMPNSFTPNGDGLNDKFKPAISQPLAAYRFIIYNRYGQIIFETTDQNKGWDGMYQNSRQPMGGYIYTCSYRFNSKEEKNVKGYFMLLH